MSLTTRLLLTLLAIVTATGAANAQLRGHGGPVRSLAISSDGKSAISGSFDTSAIIWSMTRNAADQVLRFHESAVNAVAILPDGRYVTGGEDGKIAIWSAGEAKPQRTFEGHTAPIVNIAVSPDGSTIASASWDRTIRLWPVAGGEARVLSGHDQNVNGVAFTPDGKTLVSAGYDATVRIWPLGGGAVTIVTLPTPLNAVAIALDGEIVVAGADRNVWFLSPAGEQRGNVDAGETPMISIAVSSDGELVAAAGIRGSVGIVDRKSRKLVHTLVGPGLPVWSVAFFSDNRTLLTGGADRMVRRWDARTGDHIGAVAIGGNDDPLAAFAGDRGAEVYQGVRRLPHAFAGRRKPRRTDAARHFRPQDRDIARIRFLARAEEARHRLDQGNGRGAVRRRADEIHARHQDARAADHLARRPPGAC